MITLDNQFKYWDRVSSVKTFNHQINVDRFHSIVSSKAKILDYGCGYGRTCEELHRSGFKDVTGVDSSRMMIERGHNEYPHLNLHTLKSNSIPYNSETFDAIILFAVLTCIPTNVGQKALMSEILRVLRPGGAIYISDYWLQDNERNISRYNEYRDKYNIYGVFKLQEGAIVRHHTKDWIKSLLKEFSLIDMSNIKVKSMNGNLSSGFQYFGCKQSDL